MPKKPEFKRPEALRAEREDVKFKLRRAIDVIKKRAELRRKMKELRSRLAKMSKLDSIAKELLLGSKNIHELTPVVRKMVLGRLRIVADLELQLLNIKVEDLYLKYKGREQSPNFDSELFKLQITARQILGTLKTFDSLEGK